MLRNALFVISQRLSLDRLQHQIGAAEIASKAETLGSKGITLSKNPSEFIRVGYVYKINCWGDVEWGVVRLHVSRSVFKNLNP